MTTFAPKSFDEISGRFKERMEIRHHFKTALKTERENLLTLDDEHRTQVAVVDSAYRSVLAHGGKAYYSTPITSGKLLYDVCLKKGITTPQGLADFKTRKTEFYEEVILPNIEGSIGSAKSVATKYPGAVIAPALFEASKMRWSQEAYMALWLEIIDRDVTDMYVSEGAAYSNGAVMEMTHAMLMQLDLSYRDNIRIWTDDNRMIKYPELICQIIEAAEYIKQFSAPVEHAKALQKLRAAALLIGIDSIAEKTGSAMISLIGRSFYMATKFLNDNVELLADIPTAFLLRDDEISQKVVSGRENTGCNEFAGISRHHSKNICLNVVN